MFSEGQITFVLHFFPHLLHVLIYLQGLKMPTYYMSCQFLIYVSYFLLIFQFFFHFLSAMFLFITLCHCKPVLPPAVQTGLCMSFCLFRPLMASCSNSVGFHVRCSLKLFFSVNNQRSLYSANLSPVKGSCSECRYCSLISVCHEMFVIGDAILYIKYVDVTTLWLV